MKRGIIVAAILSILIVAIISNAEMKITPGGVTFPDNTTQTTSATGEGAVWSANGLNIYYNSGNVGIGTTSPISQLEISDENKEAVYYSSAYGDNWSWSPMYLGRKARGTSTAPTAAQNGDLLNYFGGKGYGGTSWGSISNAGISLFASENFNDTSKGTKIYFLTTPNGSTSKSTRMVIEHDGNVGIGTEVPGSKLDVVGNIEMTGDGNGIIFPDGTVQLTAYTGEPAPVPKTGKTASAGNRDDGELELGVLWPVPRFTDHGDGTVTDEMTGLIWTKNASCIATTQWAIALNFCNGLSEGTCDVTDGSAAEDWRMPNVRELHSLVDFGRTDPALPEGSPFMGVDTSLGMAYWSSTDFGGSTYPGTWSVRMATGRIQVSTPDSYYRVWCVR